MYLWGISVHLEYSNFVRYQLMKVSALSNAKASKTEFHGVRAVLRKPEASVEQLKVVRDQFYLMSLQEVKQNLGSKSLRT